MNPRLFPFLITAAVAAAGVGTYISRRKRKSPAERERERRLSISRNGRIIDGTVTDVREIEPTGAEPVQLIIYQYEIAGVQYEASQDVTHLRQFIDLHSCRLGLPASIKYVPNNPGNSIVIAEDWSGLRR